MNQMRKNKSNLEKKKKLTKEDIILRECDLEDIYDCETALHNIILKEFEITEEEYENIMSREGKRNGKV